MEPQPLSFSELLSDYPSLLKGLKNYGVVTPTDLQEQLLSLPNQLQNAIIIGPKSAGKTLALILISLRRFFNEQEGILTFISHSKDLSQELFSITSRLCKIPITNLFMEGAKDSNKKNILIGSPIQLKNISKEMKQKIIHVSIFQTHYLFGFDFGKYLNELAQTLSSSVIYQLSSCEKGQEIDEFKKKWMKKTSLINYTLPQNKREVKIQKADTQAVHFYEVGQKIFLPITLYVTLKFGLVNPKVLILVQNLKEVYRYYLFLQKAYIQGIGLYNHENPIDLKFYCLSLWMSGPTNIMIATKSIYDDLDSGVFKQNCKKNFKSQDFSLNNLATVICLNLSHIEGIEKIFNHFNLKPFLMTFLQNNEKEISCLQELIKYENSAFESVKAKEYPINKKELGVFRYRINDVFMNLGSHKVQMFQSLDFKKKMIKSPDLKEYFEEHPNEKQTLIKEMNNLRNKINQETVTISKYVPAYLVPECLKSSYEQNMKKVEKQHRNQDVPQYVKKSRRALKHVDLDEEDPEHTDISRLKLISSRKRWKLQHGFKLKKRNKRNERKGIFQTS